MSDDFAICPYNHSHHILRFRMPRHLIKCEKNYRGPPLEQCIYNAQHFVPLGMMSEHLEQCEAHHSFHWSQYVKIAESYKHNN